MFRGFYQEPPGYIPDNMHKKPLPPKSASLVSDNLDVILDKKGKMKGYSWNYGETVSIPISVDAPVRIENDAYCSMVKGEAPTTSTYGRIGQKFYNLVDVKSWVLNSYVPSNKSFIWLEEPRFTFPENGERKVMIHPDMEDKYILVEFLDFRGEQMFERLYIGENKINWTLDIDQSLLLPRGIFTMMIYVGYDPEDSERQYKKLTKSYEIIIR